MTALVGILNKRAAVIAANENYYAPLYPYLQPTGSTSIYIGKKRRPIMRTIQEDCL